MRTTEEAWCKAYHMYWNIITSKIIQNKKTHVAISYVYLCFDVGL